MRKSILVTALCIAPVLLGSSTGAKPVAAHDEVRFYAYCGAAYTYLSAFYGRDRDAAKSAHFEALARGSEGASTYLVLAAMGDGDRGAAAEIARTITHDKMKAVAGLVSDRKIELFAALVSTCEQHEGQQASYASRLVSPEKQRAAVAGRRL